MNADNGRDNQSTFSWVEHPVKISPLQDNEQGWLALVVALPCDFWIVLGATLQPGLFGRMSPECCRLTMEGLLEPSSAGWQSGGMGSPGGFWTLNTPVWPNDANVCSLSDILEEIGSVPRRYFLTPRACAGIIRRAAKRGKELPPQLKAALEEVVRTTSQPAEV